jgi:probable HAF family extracellular repeat protein
MTDLGTVDGDPCSAAYGINARGDVIGTSASCNFSTSHAFVWKNDTMTDLNAFVPPSSSLQLVEPFYIDDAGAIAGRGVLPNGDMHAFVLLPSDQGAVERGHLSHRLALSANRISLREMLAVLCAREARVKHMPFLNCRTRR